MVNDIQRELQRLAVVETIEIAIEPKLVSYLDSLRQTLRLGNGKIPSIEQVASNLIEQGLYDDLFIRLEDRVRLLERLLFETQKKLAFDMHMILGNVTSFSKDELKSWIGSTLEPTAEMLETTKPREYHNLHQLPKVDLSKVPCSEPVNLKIQMIGKMYDNLHQAANKLGVTAEHLATCCIRSTRKDERYRIIDAKLARLAQPIEAPHYRLLSLALKLILQTNPPEEAGSIIKWFEREFLSSKNLKKSH